VNKVKSYFWKLEELGFTDKLVRSGRKNGSRYFYWLGELALMIFGFPLFIYGSLANYLPFYAASFLSRKLVKQREFFGAIGVAAGMLFFLIWYILLIIVLRYFQFVWWIDLLIISSWIPTGLWSWFYMRSLYYISNRWKYITVLRTHKGLMSDITQQRQEIIDEFKSIAEKLRADGIIPPA
jgi:hypothetical protein